MNWLLYLFLAVLCCGGYWLVGYLGRKTYNTIAAGRNR